MPQDGDVLMSEPDLIAELKTLLQHTKDFVAGTFELPEAATKLDLARREGDTKGLAQHLQQMTVCHNEAFRRSNQIKFTYLLEGYLQMADALNPLGVYGFARSMLELHAFVFYVSTRLGRIAVDSRCLEGPRCCVLSPPGPSEVRDVITRHARDLP